MEQTFALKSMKMKKTMKQHLKKRNVYNQKFKFAMDQYDRTNLSKSKSEDMLKIVM
jgi:hypothetical protein